MFGVCDFEHTNYDFSKLILSDVGHNNLFFVLNSQLRYIVKFDDEWHSKMIYAEKQRVRFKFFHDLYYWSSIKRMCSTEKDVENVNNELHHLMHDVNNLRSVKRKRK
jgi:hypothetical protein